MRFWEIADARKAVPSGAINHWKHSMFRDFRTYPPRHSIFLEAMTWSPQHNNSSFANNLENKPLKLNFFKKGFRRSSSVRAFCGRCVCRCFFFLLLAVRTTGSLRLHTLVVSYSQCWPSGGHEKLLTYILGCAFLGFVSCMHRLLLLSLRMWSRICLRIVVFKRERGLKVTIVILKPYAMLMILVFQWLCWSCGAPPATGRCVTLDARLSRAERFQSRA